MFHLGLESGIAGAETENVTPTAYSICKILQCDCIVVFYLCVNALFLFYRHKSIFYR